MMENSNSFKDPKLQETSRQEEKIPQNAYPKALADLYDLITTKYYDYRTAIDELSNIIGNRQRLLEIGIGTGNVAIPLTKKGYEICGVDYSPSMVNLLEEKLKNQNLQNLTIPTQIASTESFDFQKKSFDAIYSYGGDPYLIQGENQLWYEGDDAEDNIFWERLENLYGHLKPGGLLVFNIQPEHSSSNTNLNLENGAIFTTKTYSISKNKLKKTYIIKVNGSVTSFTVIKKRIPFETALEEANRIGFGNFTRYNQFASLKIT